MLPTLRTIHTQTLADGGMLAVREVQPLPTFGRVRVFVELMDADSTLRSHHAVSPTEWASDVLLLTGITVTSH